MAADLMSDLIRTTLGTPLGLFTVISGPQGVVRTAFDGDGLHGDEHRQIPDAPKGLAAVRREVEAYFRGRLRVFATPVDLSTMGDGFARRVLEIVRTIPYGELWTYGDVAAAAGVARGGRAAGSALARCPIELFVPCHRVVRAGPHLGRYGSHDERRRFLLDLEGALPGGSPHS